MRPLLGASFASMLVTSYRPSLSPQGGIRGPVSFLPLLAGPFRKICRAESTEAGPHALPLQAIKNTAGANRTYGNPVPLLQQKVRVCCTCRTHEGAIAPLH
jgi:hypothetical protein